MIKHGLNNGQESKQEIYTVCVSTSLSQGKDSGVACVYVFSSGLFLYHRHQFREEEGQTNKRKRTKDHDRGQRKKDSLILKTE